MYEDSEIVNLYEHKEFFFPELNIYEENNSLAGEHYGGKTEFAIRKIAKPLLKTGKVKVWIWDHHKRFANSEHLKGILQPNQIVYYLDELQEGSTQCYVPENKSKDHFNKFCELILRQKNLHIIYDELHNFMSAQTMVPNLYPVIRDLASNQGVTYTAIWQRISEGHKSVMSNARHKFLFNFDVEDQEKYLRIFGTQADLFLEPNARMYFAECKICGKSPKKHRNEEHRYQEKYPVLDDYSFIYKDDKSKKSEVFNGGI